MCEPAVLAQNCWLQSQSDKNTVIVSLELLPIGDAINAPGGQDQEEWGVW